MAYNTNEILRLIKARPGIRQVEIADRVDCDFEAVPNALKEQVELGNVMRKWVTGPNMVQQVAYHLAPNFELPDEPEQAKDVAPGPTPAPVTPEKPKSKVQLALDYLTTVDKADDKALRTAMGLHLGANVRAYLATQLQKRQVIQVAGGFYKLGDGKPLVKREAKGPTDAEREAQNQEQARLLREELAKVPPHNGDYTPEDIKQAMNKEADKDLVAITQDGIAKIKPRMPIWTNAAGKFAAMKHGETPDTQSNRAFACALWSDDGSLSLMRNSAVMVVLNKDEVDAMLNYLAKCQLIIKAL